MSAIVTNQSFREAGGLESFPDLEMVGTIYGEPILEREGGLSGAMARADTLLESRAVEMHLTHVFKAKHHTRMEGHPANNSYWCFAYGTGYKSKK